MEASYNYSYFPNIPSPIDGNVLNPELFAQSSFSEVLEEEPLFPELEEHSVKIPSPIRQEEEYTTLQKTGAIFEYMRNSFLTLRTENDSLKAEVLKLREQEMALQRQIALQQTEIEALRSQRVSEASEEEKPKASGKRKRSPHFSLHEAAADLKYRSRDIVKLLAHHDIDAQDGEGNTPLHVALLKKRDERIINAFLKGQPNLSLANQQGQTLEQLLQMRKLAKRHSPKDSAAGNPA